MHLTSPSQPNYYPQQTSNLRSSHHTLLEVPKPPEQQSMNPNPPQPSLAPTTSSNAVQEQLAFPSIPLDHLIKPGITLEENTRLTAALDTPLAVTTPESAAQARSTRGRSSARGRPLARRRACGPAAGRGRGVRAKRDAAAHTEGCRIQSVTEQPVKLENDFTNSVLSERARLFSCAALERMKTELQIRQLHHARSSSDVLFCDELVRKCTLWTNERLVMTNSSPGTVDRADMYAFLAVFSSGSVPDSALRRPVSCSRS